MSTSIIERATDYLTRAQEVAQKQAEEKAQKVASAEELKQKLQGLHDLKDAISEVIDQDIDKLRKTKRDELAKVDKKIQQMCDKNSEFVEKANELMKQAAEATVDTRKKTLKGVGKGIKWLRSAVKTIGDELELND